MAGEVCAARGEHCSGAGSSPPCGTPSQPRSTRAGQGTTAHPAQRSAAVSLVPLRLGRSGSAVWRRPAAGAIRARPAAAARRRSAAPPPAGWPARARCPRCPSGEAWVRVLSNGAAQPAEAGTSGKRRCCFKPWRQRRRRRKPELWLSLQGGVRPAHSPLIGHRLLVPWAAGGAGTARNNFERVRKVARLCDRFTACAERRASARHSAAGAPEAGAPLHLALHCGPWAPGQPADLKSLFDNRGLQPRRPAALQAAGAVGRGPRAFSRKAEQLGAIE